MALANKFLSPTCSPYLGDIDTYFFWKKTFRSDIRICVIMSSFWCSDVTGNPKIPKDPLFSKKKVGVFFTTSRNFLHGGLVSFGGAATLWCHKTISYDATKPGFVAS